MAATGFLLYYNRQVLKKLREVGAISVETAKTAEEAGITKREERSISRLKLIEKIKETSDGRYYIECKDGKHC